MSQAELTKAINLLNTAEQQNLDEGQAEVEAILRKRNIVMIPQFVFRGTEQIPQILFLPKSALSNKPSSFPLSQMLEEEEEEEPKE